MKIKNSKRKIIPVASILLAAVLSLTGCGAAGSEGSASSKDTGEAQTIELFAMDTTMNLTAYGENASEALTAAEDEIRRLDNLFSISSKNGDIAKINREKTAEVSDDTISLIKHAREVSAATDGVFDFTISPIMDLWGFRSKNFKVPDDAVLKDAMSRVDFRKVKTDGNTVTIPDDYEIDLGGIAKGFTSARVIDIFREYGLKSAIITLGGNVQALGQHPEGRMWNVAITDPDGSGNNIAAVKLEDASAITSGGYQRFFEENGRKYHHIIDPSTGYPAENGIISATIISKDGALADGLSTSLFIMGLDKASDFWRNHSDEFEAVLITDNRDVYVTEGLKDRFSMMDGSSFMIIEKK